MKVDYLRRQIYPFLHHFCCRIKGLLELYAGDFRTHLIKHSLVV
jgi:hypothetical protein